MTKDEPWVHKPPEIIAQVLGEISSLHVAVDGGKDEGEYCRR